MPGLLVAGVRKKYWCRSDPNVSCCQPSRPFPPSRVLHIFPLHQSVASAILLEPLYWLFSSAGISNLTQPSTGNQSQFTRWHLIPSFGIMTMMICHFQRQLLLNLPTDWLHSDQGYFKLFNLRWPNLTTTSYQVTPTALSSMSSTLKCLRVKSWSRSTWKIRSCLGTCPNFS